MRKSNDSFLICRLSFDHHHFSIDSNFNREIIIWLRFWQFQECEFDIFFFSKIFQNRMMICIRHTFVFFEILWIIVVTNRLVEGRPFFCVVLLYAVECSDQVSITSSYSPTREWDYTFHTHLILSSTRRRKCGEKISVSKEICAKRKSTTTTNPKKRKNK